MAACLPGCARQDDYPRQLDYISEINRAMENLSSQMQQLDDLTRVGEPAPQARGEILAVLNRMDQSAARLEASGWPSTHPPFDTRLDSFRRDIGLARDAASVRDLPQETVRSRRAGIEHMAVGVDDLESISDD